MRSKRPIGRAAVLVDWRNVLGFGANSPPGVPVGRFIRETMLALQNACAELITSVAAGVRYQCRMRVYDGWHTQQTPTQNRLQFERLLVEIDGISNFSRTIGCVSFPFDPEFGDRLVNDEQFGTLFDTKRAQGQKMIDTAIVADALVLLIQNYTDLIIIVSDDDDYIPALVAARAMGRCLYLLRREGRTIENVTIMYPDSPGIRHWSGL